MRETLQGDGYLMVPRVIDAAEVARLRDACEAYWQRTQNAFMPAAEYLASPLGAIPFQPAVVAALKSVLGDDYVTIPEYVMQTDQFGGWHTDSANQGPVEYVYRPEFVQVQCGVYLQDNDPEYGGGLDVKARSHRELVTIGSAKNPVRRASRLASFKLRSAVSIPSKAGDLVVFHFRLAHRATPRTKPRRKFAIFWVAAPNTPDVAQYMAHLRVYDPKQAPIPLHQYPPAIRTLIDRQQLNVAV